MFSLLRPPQGSHNAQTKDVSDADRQQAGVGHADRQRRRDSGAPRYVAGFASQMNLQSLLMNMQCNLHRNV